MSEQYKPNIGQQPDCDAMPDAIHIAVVPLVAGVALQPGTPFGLDEYGYALAACDGDDVRGNVGIVDPFRKEAIQPGEMFWGFLYPNSITNLRHAWEHPAFGASLVSFDRESRQAETSSERWRRACQWMQDFAHRCGHTDVGPGRMAPVTFVDCIQAGYRYLGEEECFVQEGDEAARNLIYAESALFWSNWSILTGVAVPPEVISNGSQSGAPFTCSC